MGSTESAEKLDHEPLTANDRSSPKTRGHIEPPLDTHRRTIFQIIDTHLGSTQSLVLIVRLVPLLPTLLVVPALTHISPLHEVYIGSIFFNHSIYTRFVKEENIIDLSLFQMKGTILSMDENIKEITSLLEAPDEEDTSLINKAFQFAKSTHEGHTRNSGEKYLNHLVETAKTLAKLGMSASTIAAGLLHDTVEDRGISLDTIEKEFGNDIAFMVDGVAKLGKLKYRGADRHNESLRKLFVAMSEDIRVLLIKLSDRLHNMQTLQYVPKEKQVRIATETLEIYAPIAYRLGIRKLNRELEDLSFPYVYPKEFENMQKTLKHEQAERLESLEKFMRSIKKALAKEGLVKVKTDYRVKGLYSLYKKLLRHNKDINNVYDVNAVRILVDTIPDCYQALGVIHASWRPLPGRIKDYISFPKPNGYQGIHTTIFTGNGDIVEVQIKTHEMHKHSEYGFASHISYKKGKVGTDLETIRWVNSLLPRADKIENSRTMNDKDVPQWIKELVAYQKNTSDKETTKDDFKDDFFSHRIFIFSPKGDVVDLPIFSTPIDFAYSIHSDIGNHMTGAKVNGKLVSLDTKLKNGDIVEVMTKPSARPNTKWIDMAKTSTTKRHIRSELSRLEKLKR